MFKSLFLLLLPTIVYSQSPGCFHIGDYLESRHDSLTIYINCNGAMVSSECAEYYREGVIDNLYPGFKGRFVDYYMDGNVAFEGILQAGLLEGPASYYHKNGGVKAIGKYSNNLKVGLWAYYYSNGQMQQKVRYNGSEPLILEYYKKSGKQMVTDGSGKYRGEYLAPLSCRPFIVKGHVNQGLRNGKWKVFAHSSTSRFAVEVYEHGRLLQGRSSGIDGYDFYTDYQVAKLDGYSFHENVFLDENLPGCPGDFGFFIPEYKGESLTDEYYPNLADSLKMLTASKPRKDQWLIIGLHVSKESNLEKVLVKSSIGDVEFEKTLSAILYSMNDFTSTKTNGILGDCDLFFSIVLMKDQIFIRLRDTNLEGNSL